MSTPNSLLMVPQMFATKVVKQEGNDPIYTCLLVKVKSHLSQNSLTLIENVGEIRGEKDRMEMG